MKLRLFKKRKKIVWGGRPKIRKCTLCHISFSLQMLKHGRAGVPMEVMGLMLGEFVDDYTVRVIDVFAMPQSGTVSTFIVACCK